MRKRPIASRPMLIAATSIALTLITFTGAAPVNARQTQPSSQATTQELPPIRNFLRINQQFCTGGQPRLEHLAKLKSEGIKSIINLRQPSEHRADEESDMAKQLGLRYYNIPVEYRNPKDEQVTEFLKLTDDPQNRPAFIHCTAAIR